MRKISNFPCCLTIRQIFSSTSWLYLNQISSPAWILLCGSNLQLHILILRSHCIYTKSSINLVHTLRIKPSTTRPRYIYTKSPFRFARSLLINLPTVPLRYIYTKYRMNITYFELIKAPTLHPCYYKPNLKFTLLILCQSNLQLYVLVIFTPFSFLILRTRNFQLSKLEILQENPRIYTLVFCL